MPFVASNRLLPGSGLNTTPDMLSFHYIVLYVCVKVGWSALRNGEPSYLLLYCIPFLFGRYTFIQETPKQNECNFKKGVVKDAAARQRDVCSAVLQESSWWCNSNNNNNSIRIELVKLHSRQDTLFYCLGSITALESLHTGFIITVE